MEWEIPFASSGVSTLLVLVVDVFALWLLEFCFGVIAAFLIAHQVYSKHKPVNISPLWFENVTGLTHGPQWFRASQFVLKLTMLAGSITIGLSINGSGRPREIKLTGQYVVAPKTRRIADDGLGEGVGNFSTELLFLKEAEVCSFSSPTSIRYQNCRAISQVAGRYGGDLEVQCLKKANGFKEELLLETFPRDANLSVRHCRKLPPLRSEILAGNSTTMVNRCEWQVTHSACQAEHKGACVFTLEKGNQQVVVVADYQEKADFDFLSSSTYPIWRKRDAETIALMAKYVDHGLTNNPMKLDYITSFHGVRASVVRLEGSTLFTEVETRLFWAGLGVIVTIISIGMIAAVGAYVDLRLKDRLHYALAVNVLQVARFARVTDGSLESRGQKLFVKLHSMKPHVTVSSTASNIGSWTEREVKHK